MTDLLPEVGLTAEQKVVVDLPVEARGLVTAGAGSGKTTTLVERVAMLMEEHEVDAGEILVLSFSRAAVAHVRSTMRGVGRGPRARTFDSWALDVLVETVPDRDWLSTSFDERIRGAAQAITAGLTDVIFEHGLRHVVLDEAQDLVGSRRQMVQALLERYDCGFTVFGDLAQSVYGFQVDADRRRSETGAFVRWLRSEFDDLVELSMTENFRALTPDARSALPLAPRVLAMSESAEGVPAPEILRDLRNLLARKLALGPPDDPAFVEFCRTTPGCAVLTRTNGQALQVSQALSGRGVRHTLRGGARDRPVPAWMVGIFERGGAVLGRDQFDLLPEIPDPDALWYSLLRVAPSSGRRGVDLGRLADLIRQRRLPDDLGVQSAAGPVVSTVHRAKGLEFDVVVLADPGPSSSDDVERDDAEEARLLYVGLTRAREETLRLVAEWDWRVVGTPVDDRWGRRGFKHWERNGLQVRDGDVSTAEPGGAGPEDSSRFVQDYLATTVEVGDPVTLRRVAGSDGSEVRYEISHRDTQIGVTSEAFGRALHAWLKVSPTWDVRTPALIEDVRVAGIETVAGSAAAGSRAGLNAHGVWLAPRLTGLGRFVREDKEESPGD